MNRYEKLAKNSIIFAIANFGTKILTLLLVPYYTYVMTTEEYGTADILLTSVTLIIPIITLYIQDAVMRFTMDKEYRREQILSIAIIIILIGDVILASVIPILSYFNIYKEYLIAIYMLIVLHGAQIVIGQFVRGIGLIKEYAIGGVIFTLALCGCTFVFLGVLDSGVWGFLIAQALSHGIALLYYVILVKEDFREISICINISVTREMIIYSIPLMPNAIMWWIMNASDKYMIMFFCGASMAGIYSVSHKIPSVLNTITTIFFQAFQISAIEEKDSTSKKEFFSELYNSLTIILLLSTSVIIFVVRPVLNILLSDDFSEASKYVPILVLAFVFSALGAYYGTFYALAKKTKGALYSTIFGAIINLIFNFLLIPNYGINGAAIGTCIGMFALFIYRMIDTKKYEDIEYSYNIISKLFIICIIQIIIYSFNLKYDLFIQGFFVIAQIFITRNILQKIIKILIKKIKKKRGV